VPSHLVASTSSTLTGSHRRASSRIAVSVDEAILAADRHVIVNDYTSERTGCRALLHS
jgi:hypothetical protein